MSKKWMSLALAGCLTLSMMTVASATFEKTYTGEHTPSASRETMAELAEAMAEAKANMEAKRGEMAEARANMEELRTQLAEKAAAIAAMKAEKESSIA